MYANEPLGPAKNVTEPSCDEKVMAWLLEDKDPSIKYRTMTELLDNRLVADIERRMKAAIYDSKPVQKIFSHMLPTGEWPGKGENVSDIFCLSHLAELSVDCEYPPMERAVQRFLEKSSEYRWGSYSCGDGLVLRALILAGYREHPFVKSFTRQVVQGVRWDGGYLCRRPANSKSCLHGSQNMLLMFSELPDLWEAKACRNLAAYFLERKIYYKRSDFTVKPKGDLKIIFPFNLRQGLLEPLYAMAKMGYGKRAELDDAWNLLEGKRDCDGRYILEWTPPKTYLTGGKKGMPSKWATLYALLALKYRNSQAAADAVLT